MKAVSLTSVARKSNGQEIVTATIVSDTEPATLPTTGNGIEGMNANMIFSPMSMIYVVDPNASHKVYVANESGVFIGQ